MAKMRLFKASHHPYNFKQFLQTGLQSIYPSTLQQHIMSQPYRNEEGLLRNIAAISAKLKSLPDPKPNPTGTLAGIAPPMQRGESQDIRRSRAKPQEEESSIRQSPRHGAVLQPHHLTRENTSDEVPSLKVLKNLRVVDLKKELVRLGLPQGGVKAALVQRIHQHFLDEEGGEKGEREPPECQDKRGQEEKIRRLEIQER